jgi:hypothetical protein
MSQKMKLYKAFCPRRWNYARRYAPEDGTMHNATSQKRELCTALCPRRWNYARRYVSEDRIFYSHRCENFKSKMDLGYFKTGTEENIWAHGRENNRRMERIIQW